MTTIRLSLVFLVLGLSMLLGLWAMGVVGGSEVSDAWMRMVAIIAIGGVAASLVLAIFGRRTPPATGGPSTPPQNGPRF